MSTPPTHANFYADFKSLAALKLDAKTDSQKALRAAAQQFESLFTSMMLKSMRSATSSIGDSLNGSNEMDLYQGMYDQQIATQMSKGKGLGLADMLVQQLTRSGLVKGGVTESQGPKADGQQSEGITSGAQPTALSPRPNSSSATSFVQSVWPHAQAAAKQLGVDPATLVAHAALETGWGKHVPCNADGSSSFNLFGIKAGAHHDQSVAANTLEYTQGSAVKRVERFKTYNSAEECFADYANVLGNSRYSGSRNSGSNVSQFAAGLQQGGYATDPHYAAKLKAVASSVMSMLTPAASNAAQVAQTQADS